MNFMLLTEFELDNITMRKTVGIAYLQDRVDQMSYVFFSHFPSC